MNKLLPLGMIVVGGVLVYAAVYNFSIGSLFTLNPQPKTTS